MLVDCGIAPRGAIKSAAITVPAAAPMARDVRIRDAVETIVQWTHRVAAQVYSSSQDEASSKCNSEMKKSTQAVNRKNIDEVQVAPTGRLGRQAADTKQLLTQRVTNTTSAPMTNAQERKAQERQARRRRIQEAARTVFTERGYAGASIELIARAAQLSVGAIYLYFRSKEDLYVSLIEDTLTVFDVEMAQVREQTEPSNRLRDTWNLLVRWAEKDAEGPRILRLLAQPAIRPQLSDEVVSAVSSGIGRVQDHIGACVADGIHAGIYRQVSAREIADLAWSVLLGSLDAAEMHVNIGLSSEPLSARTDRALHLIESALTAVVSGSLRAVA